MRIYHDNGGWTESVYDAEGNEITYRDSNDYWFEKTFDKFGNVLNGKNSAGYWSERTRDAFGNLLTFKCSSGEFRIYTRNAKGEELTYENERGVWLFLAEDDTYTLRVKKGLYWAGCVELRRSDALAHWNRKDERAKLFTQGILRHTE